MWHHLRQRIRHVKATILKTEYIEVFHEDSPGVRVWVKRNWAQRLYSPTYFARVGEPLLPYEQVAKQAQSQARIRRPLDTPWTEKVR